MCEAVDIHGLGAVARAVEGLRCYLAAVHVNYGNLHLAIHTVDGDGGASAGGIGEDGAGGAFDLVDTDGLGGEAGADEVAVLAVTADGADLGDI